MAGVAAAQQGPVGFDPGKPTELDAERAELLEGGNKVLAEGDVRISQPGVVLTADRMDVYFVTGTREIDRLVAVGRVRYASVSGDAVAGDRAVYTAADSLLTVSGNVVVLQDSQVATAETLTYNTATGAMVMTGGEGRRVRGLFSRQEGS